MIKCDHCPNEATHIDENDPYDEDVLGEENPGNFCDECWKNACDDI